MNDISVPGPKRRKLETKLRHQYIAIVQASKNLFISDNALDAGIAENLTSEAIPVWLKDSWLTDVAIRGYFAPVCQRSLPMVPFDEATQPKNSVGEILKYCSGLDSIFKCKEDRLPLVCSEITLTPRHESSPRRSSFFLEARILWQDTVNPRIKMSSQHLSLLLRFLPAETPLMRPAERPESWDPRDFYESAHVPADTLESSAELITTYCFVIYIHFNVAQFGGYWIVKAFSSVPVVVYTLITSTRPFHRAFSRLMTQRKGRSMLANCSHVFQVVRMISKVATLPCTEAYWPRKWGSERL